MVAKVIFSVFKMDKSFFVHIEVLYYFLFDVILFFMNMEN